ncbi:D-2-hydroxyacid dehydrogenase [Alcanivorax sp. 1008]|uniref:D-2-hydroxyacid dehydrogenase n=1 Tax=Alcanivorax sp. 1008 TaxID=2816853 RepID=UPI001D66D9AE|nr:D-2-hydroxyacid dehydrogenase [Alcanivorax sp. 1008]MCC1496927.1 D-2-hydroxyacid dehydrogenase [Alcanivorax sp. 1008]
MRGVVLDLDTLHPQDLSLDDLQASLPDWQLFAGTSPEDTAARIAGCQVVVTNKVVIDRAAMHACADLKLICVSATGTNNVDLQAATERGIVVCNVRDYAAASLAQHVFALLLALATRWHQYAADVQAGEWSRSPMFCLMHRPVMELAGKTFGVIGYGVLGREVARLAQAFGMRVLVSDSLRPGVASQPDRVPLATLLRESDVISLHCPLDKATAQLVNKDFLAAMKPGAVLINTARGGLVDEAALKQALLDGQLAGAALDVLSVEPPPADHLLLDAAIPNLIITPHNAWVSRECRQRLLDGVVANIEGWKAGKPVNPVLA